MASLALAIVFSAPAQAQAGNEQMMNLVLQVQQLQDEIRALRGQVERAVASKSKNSRTASATSTWISTGASVRPPGRPGPTPARSIRLRQRHPAPARQ